MSVIVTTVAFLVMIYTDGYMAHDPGYVRFYAYLSIFSSSMLGLVISPNLVRNLRFLGIGGDVFLSAGRFLVHSSGGRQGLSKSLRYQPRRRFWSLTGNAGSFLGNWQLRV
ncbi:MAG UNVERIFIED_CONTAM: hypothetical protein LVR29_28795 [Microcystis novacekii LVE1205-3]